jgi:gas vesicle protein
MKRPVEDGLSLLLGAGVGMAMMYLLDPQAGSDRRELIQKAARERLAQARDAASAGMGQLHGAVERAGNTTAVQALAAHAADAAKAVYHEIGQHAGAAVDDYRQQASDAATGAQARLSDKLSDLRDNLRGRAGDMSANARSNYGKWLKRASLAAGRDEDHHYIGQTTCALGSLALGAGAVYLFDPERGHERRAKLIEGATSVVQETGEFFRKTGRRLVTRGRVAARAVADRAHEGVWQWEPSKQQTPSPAEPNESAVNT